MDKDDITEMCKDLGIPGGIKAKLNKGLRELKAQGGGAAAPPPAAAAVVPAAVVSAPAAVVVPNAMSPPPPQGGSPAPPAYQPPGTPTPTPPGMCARCYLHGKPNIPAYQGTPYCGKRCRDAAKQEGWVDGNPPGYQPAPGQAITSVTVAGPTAGQASALCGFCGVKAVQPGHPYCGRGCATKAKASGMSSPVTPRQPVASAVATPMASAVATPMATTPMAVTPGPPAAAVTSPTAPPGMCAFCWSKPVATGHPFCGSTCGQAAKAAGWKGGLPPGSAQSLTLSPAVGMASAGGGAGSPVISPAAVASPAVPTYHVMVPINPAALGMQVGADLTIENVTPGSMEANAGIAKGSKVCSVNSKPVLDQMGFFTELAQSVGAPVRLELTYAAPSPVPGGGGGLGQPPSGTGPLPSGPVPPGMCEYCRSKPVFKPHKHCSRTCAANAAAATPPAAATATATAAAPAPCPPGMCAFCQARKVFQGSYYCGMYCKGQAEGAGWVDGIAPGATAAPAPAPAGGGGRGGGRGRGGGGGGAEAAAAGPCPPGMCPFCHSTGIAKAVSAGQPYCGRSCGQNASAAGWVDGVDPAAVQAATSTGSVCRQCRQKPQQNGHPYCSHFCAKAYDQSHVWSAQVEKTATKGVKKYTIDDQLSSMSAMQTEDTVHFNTAFTQYGKLLQGQQKLVQKVEYYINPNLQANFDRKQAEFKVRAAAPSSFLLPSSSFLLPPVRGLLAALRGVVVVIHPAPAPAELIDVNLRAAAAAAAAGRWQGFQPDLDLPRLCA